MKKHETLFSFNSINSSIIGCGGHGHGKTFSISTSNLLYHFGDRLYDVICPPKQIDNVFDIIMISGGFEHYICLDNNSNIYVFGSNEQGQLGLGKKATEYDNVPTIYHLSSLPPIWQISCGDNFTICLSNDGLLYSFGENYYGQLGLGNLRIYRKPKLIPNLTNINFVTCGGNFVICKTYNNEFYSWGNNNFGQLGQGNTLETSKPIQCLNWPNNIIDIKAGAFHVLLLTFEGKIYSFGRNSAGQLGLNISKLFITSPQLIESGECKNSTYINSPLVGIDNIPEIYKISCGTAHSFCIDIEDNLWLFGFNSYGQLGLGDNINRFKPTKNHLLKNIIDISYGGHHTLVKTSDNKIYAFGNNDRSQLGIKKTQDYKFEYPIQVLIGMEDIWKTNIRKSTAKSARK